MQILNPSRHRGRHADQILTRATQSSIRNTSPAEFVTKTIFDDTLYSQEPITFVKQYDDDDVAHIFIDALEKNNKDMYKKFRFPKGMIMTMHDNMTYDNSTLCHICNEELGKDRVRDHCHLTDIISGAAHDICNLKCKIPKFFPVVSHNLSGYDSHLFIKTLGNSK